MLLLVFVAAKIFAGSTTTPGEGYSKFVTSLNANEVTSVELDPARNKVTYLSLIHISEPTRPY